MDDEIDFEESDAKLNSKFIALAKKGEEEYVDSGGSSDDTSSFSSECSDEENQKIMLPTPIKHFTPKEKKRFIAEKPIIPNTSTRRDNEKDKELTSSLKKLRLSNTTKPNTTKDLKENNKERAKGEEKENRNRKSVEKNKAKKT